MRLCFICVALALAACNQSPPASQSGPQQSAQTTLAAPAVAPAAPAPWFICDGVDTPSLFVLTQHDGQVEIVEYGKRNGAEASRVTYALGEGEGAAGSVYTPFLQDGQQAGYARALNPGMLDPPGEAFTEPFTSIQLGDRVVSCRWLARTRLMGFTSRRSFVVSEDEDGDLIYTTFNFAEAASQRPVDLSGSQRSTTFSLEVRAGVENTGPAGAAFRFSNGGYVYDISAPRAGGGAITVSRDGAVIQTEPLLGAVTGQGAG